MTDQLYMWMEVRNAVSIMLITWEQQPLLGMR